mmetsp:Transcript_6851/g.18537  ORF Transcript_6851/g.18537 Transcript_6851/m.18537 type:complete len:218 (+) Transcript_6851:184-837(+)
MRCAGSAFSAVRFSCANPCSSSSRRPSRSAATRTGSILTYCASSSTVASRPRPTTSSWATMWIAASRALRPSACCSPTRSSTLRTSSSSGGTTSARPSTAFTASTTSASGATTSNCGRLSPTASTAFLCPPSWMRRSSACTEASRPTCTTSTKSRGYRGPRTSPTRDCSATSSGPTRTRTCTAGGRTIEACRTRLVPILSPSSCNATSLTSSAARTR